MTLMAQKSESGKPLDEYLRAESTPDHQFRVIGGAWYLFKLENPLYLLHNLFND
jgi:hypothetical protein